MQVYGQRVTVLGQNRTSESFQAIVHLENFLSLMKTVRALTYARNLPALPWFDQVPMRPYQKHPDRFYS